MILVFPFFSRDRFRHFSTFGFQCRVDVDFFSNLNVESSRMSIDIDIDSTFSTFSTLNVDFFRALVPTPNLPKAHTIKGYGHDA